MEEEAEAETERERLGLKLAADAERALSAGDGGGLEGGGRDRRDGPAMAEGGGGGGREEVASSEGGGGGRGLGAAGDIGCFETGTPEGAVNSRVPNPTGLHSSSSLGGSSTLTTGGSTSTSPSPPSFASPEKSLSSSSSNSINTLAISICSASNFASNMHFLRTSIGASIIASTTFTRRSSSRLESAARTLTRARFRIFDDAQEEEEEGVGFEVLKLG